jgi:hypothetical protein
MEKKKPNATRKRPKYPPHPKEGPKPPSLDTSAMQIDPMPPRPKPSIGKSNDE